MTEERHNPISLQNIRLNDRFWSRRAERIAKEVIPYQWDALNDNVPGAEPSHAIENFRIAAGEVTGEFHGMVFQDSDVAKWIEAASYSLHTHPNPKLEAKIDSVIELMERAQRQDGYLNTYFTVAKPEKRWTDFSFGHELYCAGHLMEAAVAYYNSTGKKKFLTIMSRYADYIDSVIGAHDEKMKVYCGHEEIELALMRLFQATGEERYLRLSQYFIDERGKQPCFLKDEPTFGHLSKTKWFDLDYHQVHAPVRAQTTAEGHSVRAMYLYSAMADLAKETKDESLSAALEKLWDNTTKRRMYITGGLGSQGHGERFTIDFDLPNDRVYAETCAAIGLIFWAQRMLLLSPDHRYADVMERALYNGALSGISMDGKKYFYVNPLEVIPEVAENRHDHEHIQVQRQEWFGCACCPPNIARLIASLGQYVYSQRSSTIYTHLYIGSEGAFEINGQPVVLQQQTNYPWSGEVTISLKIEESQNITIALRIPGWCKKQRIIVNGQIVDNVVIDKGYAMITRKWMNGDQINLNFDMPIELTYAHPKVREIAGKVAIERGPLVYCLEETDNGSDLWSIMLPSESKLESEFQEGLFGGVVIIKGDARRSDNEGWGDKLYSSEKCQTRTVNIQAVPYYLWGNRQPSGEMTVWIRNI
ncbi:beta-L-arabinofuranosidase domain-containing protein [Pelosinus sp. IPA-1]|uniref:glycoside hydrolase family 127 protein n=1 Tax=Pelosinus sp. IPA-1 TaxID=3029569 RepID=UPI00243619AD|nr:beta-L-arabinofuranosidase domain-containing protein [Pelosinus sp. IPA-1]GMB01150.1 hypothetical protein PIPA1_39490 [Pelosinus sp. IPA-1]